MFRDFAYKIKKNSQHVSVPFTTDKTSLHRFRIARRAGNVTLWGNEPIAVERAGEPRGQAAIPSSLALPVDWLSWGARACSGIGPHCSRVVTLGLSLRDLIGTFPAPPLAGALVALQALQFCGRSLDLGGTML